MATKKEQNKEEKKKEPSPPKVDVSKSLEALHIKVELIIKTLENVWNIDINRDGKVGATRIRALLVLGLGSLLMATSFVFGAEDIYGKYLATEGNDVVLQMEADEGDDTDDELKIGLDTDNDFFVKVGDDDVLRITKDGALTTTSFTAGSTNYTGGVSADTSIILTDTDGSATISAIAFEASDAILILDADEGDDAADTWTIESEATGNDLSIMNSTIEVVNVTSGGDLQIDGDLTITGNGLNAAGDLVITPTGTEVHINGGLDVGGTGSTGDNNLNVVGTAAVGGTLAVTGVGTFTAESVHNAGIDADGITVDAADGIDTKTAGTLLVGDATANRVEIADTGITTDVEGPLSAAETLAVIGVGTFTAQPVFNGGIDVNEDIDIDLDAADEEINIAQAAVAGTADVPLILVNDDRTGATANTAGESTLYIDAEGTHAIGVIDGIVAVESILDTYGAGALLLGSATATSVEIADAAVTTDIQGPLTVLEATGNGIDTAGAGALFLGEATATSVSIGKAGGDTTILGPLNVLEATTKGIDTTGAGLLYIGEDVATGVTLGATDADVIVAGDLDVVSRFSMGHTASYTTAGPTDNLDVAGINVLFVDPNAGSVTIGGFVNGVAGQILYIVSIHSTNDTILENNESTGNQDIFLDSEADETNSTKGGGWILACNGTSWFEVGSSAP